MPIQRMPLGFFGVTQDRLNNNQIERQRLAQEAAARQQHELAQQALDAQMRRQQEDAMWRENVVRARALETGLSPATSSALGLTTFNINPTQARDLGTLQGAGPLLPKVGQTGAQADIATSGSTTKKANLEGTIAAQTDPGEVSGKINAANKLQRIGAELMYETEAERQADERARQRAETARAESAANIANTAAQREKAAFGAETSYSLPNKRAQWESNRGEYESPQLSTFTPAPGQPPQPITSRTKEQLGVDDLVRTRAWETYSDEQRKGLIANLDAEIAKERDPMRRQQLLMSKQAVLMGRVGMPTYAPWQTTLFNANPFEPAAPTPSRGITPTADEIINFR